MSGNTALDVFTVGATGNPFGGGGSKPFVYPRLPKVGAKKGYDFFSAGADFAKLIGHGNEAEYLTNRASKFTPGDTPYTSPFTNPDGSTNWEALGPGGLSHDAQNALIRGERERLTRAGNRGADFNWDSVMNKYKVGLSQDIEGAMKQGLISEIDPSLQAAQKAADANLSTSMIDAGTEAAIRSRFVAAAKQDSATRLSRIGAGLGLGNTANSPAAAALAAQDAQAADAQIAGGLRDMSIQTQQMNRQQHSADIELAAKIARQRFDILNGDSKSIIGMQNEITSTIDALYARDQTMQLQQQALDLSGKHNTGANVASGFTSGAAGGAALGPWGALAGGVAGGGLAYLGSR